jgi:hypothetical protein
MSIEKAKPVRSRPVGQVTRLERPINKEFLLETLNYHRKRLFERKERRWKDIVKVDHSIVLVWSVETWIELSENFVQSLSSIFFVVVNFRFLPA